MDDAARVRVRERRGDRSRELGDLVPGPLAAAGHIPETRPVDVLHDEERCLAILAVVVEPDDVLMLERSENLGFAGEPAAQFGVLGDPRVKQLDGNIALQVPVIRTPDCPHAALGNAGTELVAAGEKVGHTREIARFWGKQARNGARTVAADPRGRVVK